MAIKLQVMRPSASFHLRPFLKTALVIGNAAYTQVAQLDNPTNDAEDIVPDARDVPGLQENLAGRGTGLVNGKIYIKRGIGLGADRGAESVTNLANSN